MEEICVSVTAAYHDRETPQSEPTRSIRLGFSYPVMTLIMCTTE